MVTLFSSSAESDFVQCYMYKAMSNAFSMVFSVGQHTTRQATIGGAYFDNFKSRGSSIM